MSKDQDDLPFDEHRRAELERLMAATEEDRPSQQPLKWRLVPNRAPKGPARPVEVDHTVAAAWLRYSLGQGEVISPAALRVVEKRSGRTITLAPESVDPARLATPDQGWVATTTAANEALVTVLDALAVRGASCVIVEDDLRLRKDPPPKYELPGCTGYMGERIVYWTALASRADLAVQLLNAGASGYPLNAVVTSTSEGELGLIDGADLPPGIGAAVARSLMAVIVGAYDGETFMIWQPSEADT